MDRDESHPSLPSNRAGNADIGRGKTNTGLGSKQFEWTNEKHNMYLNSVEESFVNQLYSSDYRREDPSNWILRTQNEPISPSGSSANSMCSGQIKLQRRGHRENHKFDSSCAKAQTKDESHAASEVSDQNFVDKDCDRDQGHHGRQKVYYRRNNGWKH